MHQLHRLNLLGEGLAHGNQARKVALIRNRLLLLHVDIEIELHLLLVKLGHGHDC